MSAEGRDGRGNWVSRKSTPRLILIVLVLAAFMFVLARAIPTRSPAEGFMDQGDSWTILHIFEMACALFMLLSFLHASLTWGWKKAVFFFAFALVYGFILEDITVTFSNYYSYNPHAWLELHNTMLAVPFCWTAVIYISTKLMEGNPVLSGLKKIDKWLIAGILAVSIDVGIDAVFVAYGLWSWKEGQWFGVPLANYTAWFMAVGGFTAFWADMESSKLPQLNREIGLACGAVFSYGVLLLMVALTYFASMWWFSW
jgi:uncharacterized membrane protein